MFSKKKTLFIIYGIINLFFTNLILQILLILIPTILSTFISQVFNFLFGFYFYGKNVFKIKKINRYHFTKYLFLNIFLWNLNWITINYLGSFGFSKNNIAFFLIPFLALLSYLLQRYIIFLE